MKHTFAFFNKLVVMGTMRKGPRVDFCPLLELNEDPEPSNQRRSLVPICLLGEFRLVWVSLSWFSDLPYWLMILSFV